MLGVDAGDQNLSRQLIAEPFHKADRELVLRKDPSGLLSGLHFAEAAAADDLAPGFVEIEPRAFGLNFRDVLVSLGEIEGEFVGQECSGIVTRLGPGTEAAGLRVGDRVCAVTTCNIGTKQIARLAGVARIPESMSWAVAASIPIVFVSAWVALRDRARLRKGESVLIHAATGGFGQAVIALAQHMGAGRIFATCSTTEKRDLLVREHGLDPKDIFSSRNDDFRAAISKRTSGKGVDVIINSLAGSLFQASWALIAQDGRFVDVGKRDSEAGRHIDMAPFTRGATLTSIELMLHRTTEDHDRTAQLIREGLTACVQLVADRAVRIAAPMTEYPMSQLEKVLRMMQGAAHLGKIVLVPGQDDIVKVAVRPPPPVAFSSDATYLIAGGARGIGLGIARWMVERGAMHVVLVSRNASRSDGADSTCTHRSRAGLRHTAGRL